MFIRKFHRYQNEVAAVAEPAAAPVAAPAAPAPNALQAAAAATPVAPAVPAETPAVAAPATPFGWIPDKFQVKTADGSLDFEASARKVEEHRTNLERRLGSGDIRPAAITDYKVNLPADLADKISAEDLGKSKGYQEGLTALHEAGASQKIVDVFTEQMVKRGMELQDRGQILDQAECTAELKQVDGWKTEQEYAEKMSAAARAVRGFGGQNAAAIMATYGNDPAMCQLFAAIGAEMQEDRQASPEAAAALSSTLDELYAHPAYTNANHAQHADIKGKVDALQARVSGTKAVASGKTLSFKT